MIYTLAGLFVCLEKGLRSMLNDRSTVKVTAWGQGRMYVLLYMQANLYMHFRDDFDE